jgi:hypothetical protein
MTDAEFFQKAIEVDREARRLEREKLRPYLRHTEDCCAMLRGGEINPLIEHFCTCGLNEILNL